MSDDKQTGCLRWLGVQSANLGFSVLGGFLASAAFFFSLQRMEREADRNAPLVIQPPQITPSGTLVPVDNPATVPRHTRWVVFTPAQQPEPRRPGAGAVESEFVVVFRPEHWSEQRQRYEFPTLGFHTPPNARSIIKASIADDRYGNAWVYGDLVMVVEDPKSTTTDGLGLVTLAKGTFLRSLPSEAADDTR